MTAEEELRQMAIAHDLFCELNPKSKDTLYLFYGYCWSRKRVFFDSLLRRR